MSRVALRFACLTIILANAIFWIVVAAYSVATGDDAAPSGPLRGWWIFVLPVLFLAMFWGVYRVWKPAHLLAIPLALTGAVLPLTREVDPLGIAAIVLSLLAFVGLASIWPRYFPVRR